MSADLTAIVPSQLLADFCHRNHIRRLSLFGSALRNGVRPESDVDLLVEFEPDHVPGFIGLGTVELRLSELLHGRRIDLHTPGSLNAAFRQDVVGEAQVLFDRSER